MTVSPAGWNGGPAPSSLLSPSKVSLRLWVCCHKTNFLCPCTGCFQPARALYRGWESSGGWPSSCPHATNGHQHLLPTPPAPSLREGLKARLALVALLAHHTRFAAAPAVAVALWAEGTCGKRGRRGLDRHLPAPSRQCCCLQGSKAPYRHCSSYPPPATGHPLRSQHRTETPGLAVKAAPAFPTDAGDLEDINPSRH